MSNWLCNSQVTCTWPSNAVKLLSPLLSREFRSRWWRFFSLLWYDNDHMPFSGDGGRSSFFSLAFFCFSINTSVPVGFLSLSIQGFLHYQRDHHDGIGSIGTHSIKLVEFYPESTLCSLERVPERILTRVFYVCYFSPQSDRNRMIYKFLIYHREKQ